MQLLAVIAVWKIAFEINFGLFCYASVDVSRGTELRRKSESYERKRNLTIEVCCANADQRAVKTYAEERSLKWEEIKEVWCTNFKVAFS